MSSLTPRLCQLHLINPDLAWLHWPCFSLPAFQHHQEIQQYWNQRCRRPQCSAFLLAWTWRSSADGKNKAFDEDDEEIAWDSECLLPCLAALYQNLWLLQVSTLEASVIAGQGIGAYKKSLETLGAGHT